MSVAEFHAEMGYASADKLGELFAHYGSDKSGRHNYHLVYAAILAEMGTVSSLLEVGLGSSNTNVPSNMGPLGRPGASLRAFRDYLPGAAIYGADVDERALFAEPSISTFHVDQTDLSSVERLGDHLPDRLDLVIDDGLHSPNANLAVLLLGLDKVHRGGWIVIEDIAPAAAAMWEAIAALIGNRGDCYLIDSRAALMFCVRC
ncbi:class I SAM-dependent methyltransferase [Nocardioides sp. AN3]